MCNELHHCTPLHTTALLHTTTPTYRGHHTDSPKPHLGERIRSWMTRAGVMMMPVAYAPRIGTKSAVARTNGSRSELRTHDPYHAMDIAWILRPLEEHWTKHCRS